MQKRTTPLLVTLLIMTSIFFTGCGQKGNLYLPDSTQQTTNP
ncbi:MAG: lipoprotein [Gammaproteobacteria bacterium]|nr:lipoprotein [Gammaproteobacteria bacterium]